MMTDDNVFSHSRKIEKYQILNVLTESFKCIEAKNFLNVVELTSADSEKKILDAVLSLFCLYFYKKEKKRNHLVVQRKNQFVCARSLYRPIIRRGGAGGYLVYT
jgi:hypothetical protein